MQTNNL